MVHAPGGGGERTEKWRKKRKNEKKEEKRERSEEFVDFGAKMRSKEKRRLLRIFTHQRPKSRVLGEKVRAEHEFGGFGA